LKIIINKSADVKAVDVYEHGLLDQALAVRDGGEIQFEIYYLYLHPTIGIPLNKLVGRCRFSHLEYFLPLYSQTQIECTTNYEHNILHFAAQNPHYIVPDLIN
jgi:hypothetical protein